MTRGAIVLAAALQAIAQDGATPLRFEEIGAQAGVRVPHRTRRFTGAHADVLTTTASTICS
jgi:hypothetical protein